uniref:Uncharacterized protein n=1 Tax=Oryza glaberrima TaxID=4538 RepID=I1PJC8_ORYGL
WQSRLDQGMTPLLPPPLATSATSVGEVIPFLVRSGCPHILCLSHKKLGNAFATCYCRARMTMQQMTGRGYLYRAMPECLIVAGYARAMTDMALSQTHQRCQSHG